MGLPRTGLTVSRNCRVCAAAEATVFDFAAVSQALEPADLLEEKTSTRILIDDVVSEHLPKLVSRLSSEALTEADKYSPADIQRKITGPFSSAGVCPLYMVNGLDISADVVNTLNSMYPAPAATASVARSSIPRTTITP